MKYLPIFLDLHAAPCLVVGGGVVGARRIALLREAGARVTVVAPELCEELAAAVTRGDVQHRARAYEGSDCQGQRVVIAATDEHAINERVAADARAAGIPVNVVDAPVLCSFIMPAIVDRSPVTVAVSTGGASPVLARLTRGRLEAVLHPDYGRLAELAARYRQEVKQRVPDGADRRRVWERALEGQVAALVLAGRMEEAERELERLIASDGPSMTRVAVVFAGDGDVQQLSLRALSRLGSADVIVHPQGGAEGVIALARRDAQRVAAHGGGAEQVVESALRALESRPGLGTLCIVLEGAARSELEHSMAVLGAIGELELIHPAPR